MDGVGEGLLIHFPQAGLLNETGRDASHLGAKIADLGPEFQVTGMIEWRQKLKPQKIPGLKFNPPKNPMSNFRAIKISRGTMWPGHVGTITNLKIVLKTQNQATQKNTYQTFFHPPKSRHRKFQTQKNPSIIPVTWNPEYPPSGILVLCSILEYQYFYPNRNLLC